METSDDDSYDFWKNWDLKNLTEAEYLAKVLGPKYLSMRMVIPLTIIYMIIFVTGIFGNITTCTVIIKNPAMQTATNYYLFSLAISDLILLVLGLPNELSLFWQQYPWVLGVSLCKIRAYVSEMCRGYIIFHLLGSFSHSAITLRLCARIWLLSRLERMAIYFKRMSLLFQYNYKSHFI